MNWSQENCLISNHRLTCERWGRGFIGTAKYYGVWIGMGFFEQRWVALPLRGKSFCFCLPWDLAKGFSHRLTNRWEEIAHTFHSVLWNNNHTVLCDDLSRGSLRFTFSNNCFSAFIAGQLHYNEAWYSLPYSVVEYCITLSKSSRLYKPAAFRMKW